MTFQLKAALILILALVTPIPSGAEPPAKLARIGWLGAANPAEAGEFFRVFVQALRERGWNEGQNIQIESRYAEGKLDRVAPLAAELVALNLDVIFAPSTAATLALKEATSTIPVVFHVYADPVGLGLVASMARPGGNMTGLSVISDEISGKRLELLSEAFPRVSRVAVLVNSAHVSSVQQLKETQRAAQALGIDLLLLDARVPEEFESAFSRMDTAHADALIVIENPTYFTRRKRIVELAAKTGKPTMYGMQPFVDDGGLMSYSVNYPDQFRRAAAYVDKILKGARPGGLPVEQPTKVELLINLKAAKALGLTIPQSLLLRADKVIE
jgi:putative tryptophan/tyrosine transport system substrate-binding protein